MDFLQLCEQRESCRAYDAEKPVSEEDVAHILEAMRLAPSACNAQPYTVWVCTGARRTAVAQARSLRMNAFIEDAPLLLVITEHSYNWTAKVGAAIKQQDYRSVDIGILAAHGSLAATALGLGSCLIGMFDEKRIQQVLGTKERVRLILAIGHPKTVQAPRKKVRRPEGELFRRR